MKVMFVAFFGDFYLLELPCGGSAFIRIVSIKFGNEFTRYCNIIVAADNSTFTIFYVMK